MLGNISIKKLAIILGIIFVASGLIAGVIFFAQYGVSGFNPENLDTYENNVDIEKKADLQDIHTIYVESSSHDIKLISTDSNEVKAHFYGGYSSSSKAYKPELIVTNDGEKLLIRIKDNTDRLMFTFRSNLKLDVYIPSQFDDSVNVKASSAEVYIGELSLNNLSIETSSGSVDTGSVIAEKAVIDTSSGEIDVNGKYSELNVKSSSGCIESDSIEAVTSKFESSSGEITMSGNLTNLTAKSTSGSISISSSEHPETILITSNSGEAELRLPDSAGFKLTCQSTSGEINVGFPVTVTGTTNESEHVLSGTVGNGRGDVSITTTSGSINVTK